MKKYRKIGVILFIVIFATTTVFAGVGEKYKPYADSLYKLGIFTGTDEGYELDRAPYRPEGIAMVVRLLGAEEEAKAITTNTTPFTDVPSWAVGYVSYAYEKGLTNGVSETKFGSNVTMNASMYITYLLRSLGYSDDEDGDFTFENSLDYAKGLKLIDESLYNEIKTSFLRGHVTITSYNALRFPYYNTKTLLIEKLTAEGKADSAKANYFISNPVTSTDTSSEGDKDGKILSTEEIAENVESMVMVGCASATTSTTGSGIIISSDGEILTNYHIIEGATEIAIKFNDNEIYEGIVYVQDYDAALDLAVLKINKNNLKAVTLGNSDEIKLGQKVVAIGSPMGLFNTVSEGIVSSLREDSIQTSAAISHGSSGGALFDVYGKVIGVTYAGIEDGQNLGFAIPINYLTQVSEKKMMSFTSATGGKSTSQSSVKGGDQSSTANADGYYIKHPKIPDFGVFANKQVFSIDETGYIYKYDFDVSIINSYFKRLEKEGFAYVNKEVVGGNTVYIFASEKDNLAVGCALMNIEGTHYFGVIIADL